MNDIKVAIIDYETYKAILLLCVFLPHTGEKIAFEVSGRKNDLYALIKFIREGDYEYQVGYNNIGFDGQVTQYILDNYEKWTDLTGLEICSKVYDFTQELIDNQNYDIRPKYHEKHMDFKQIDLFKIWHFDNQNKRTSLKWVEFSIDVDIETLPIYHGKEELSVEEIEKIVEYCWKDISATYEFYKITRGWTENPLYKGKDKLQLRFDLKEEIGLDCINWNDVKIGEEWNRKDYMEITKRSYKECFPKKVRYFYGMKYREFFPNTVNFQTPEIKKYIKNIGETFIINKKQEFVTTLGNNKITIARGGIHSAEKPRIIKSDKEHVYIQTDIGSQYPNAYRKYGLYPLHLGKPANEIATIKIDRRLRDKQQFKETNNPRFESLAESGKFALNGGLYGKLKQKGSFLEDHVCQLKITMGCQLEILMITEDLVLKGFNVVSLNTDGWDTVVQRSRLEEFYEICNKWEKTIGNDVLGNFEYTEFEWIVQLSVNDYLAKLPTGKYKEKGDLATKVEIHKNKSRLIIPIALKAYFGEGRLPEETIRNHKNIFDFCIGLKATKDFYYEGVDRQTGEVKKYDKLIRYYVSTEGEKLYKVKKEGVESKAPPRRECEAGIPYQTLFNTVVKHDNFEDYKIDYSYYENKVYDIISRILPEVKQKRHNEQNGILTLF